MNFQSDKKVFLRPAKHKLWILINTSFMLLFCSLSLSLYAQGTQNKDTTASTYKNVSVAYGFQNKDEVTGAISSVSGTDLSKTHTSNISNALFGRLPGVTVTHNGGSPGFDDANILIRGSHTLQNNGYLILLDGFPISSLDGLSAEEIENISVLKDAAALVLYGIKGANGAILVTTKRGHASQKINIGFNAQYGYQMPTQLPKFMGSYDYARLYNEALSNDGLPPLYTEKQLNGYQSGADPYMYPDVNWYNQILRKGSPLQDYSLSFDGGNKNAKYFLMLGYLNNEGLYAHTDQKTNSNNNFQRINFRANVDLNITKRLSAQVGLGGNIEDRMFPPIATADLWKNMATYAPNLYPVRTPDGQITGSANFPNNPVGDLLEKGYQSRHDRTVQATVKLTENMDFLTKGLSMFGSMFFNSQFYSRYDKTKNYVYYEPIKTTTSAGADSLYYLPRGVGSDLTVVTGNNVENNRTDLQVGFNYNRTFNKNEVGAMVMYMQDKYSVLGNQAADAMQNILGRLTYNFKRKYFVEGGFSYSGTDNYAPNERFGFFPSLSAAWLINKESFWKENSTVNYLKLKGSAGMVGNDRGAPQFGYNQYWGTAANQGYYFGTGQTFYNALVQLGIANPDITWEKALLYNFGLETMLFNNKLSFNADVFYENRYDILVNMGNVTPSLSGIPTAAMENRGKVLNYGTEVQTMFKDKAGEVNYFVGGQFSFAHNKIKENFEVPKKEAYSSRNNNAIGQYFGLEAIGFFKDQSDIISSPVQTFSNVLPGDIKYKDQNNDGIIDVDDEVAIRRQNYPEISFGFNTGVSYKGFNLELFFQGTANRSVYLNGYMFQPFVNNANISEWAAAGRWTAATSATATFPRLTTQSNANNYQSSTFWVRNVSFVRLSNIELGYTIPQRILRKMHVDNLRIFVSGLNLFTWDTLDVNVDPETLSTGYPVIKTYTAGLSMKF